MTVTEGPQMPGSGLSEAAALFTRGDDVGAERVYRSLQREAATRMEASYGLGLIALRQGHSEQASVWFTLIQSDEPRYVDACFYLAIIARDRGDVGQARVLCAQVLHARPEHRQANALWQQLNVSAAPTAAGPAPDHSASTPSRVPANAASKSELYLPSGGDEASAYAADLLLKKRATYWTSWRARPTWVKAAMIAFYAVFAAAILTVGAIVIYGAVHHNTPSTAGTRAWCQGVYDQYSHTAPLPAPAKDALAANDCQKYGIPPG